VAWTYAHRRPKRSYSISVRDNEQKEKDSMLRGVDDSYKSSGRNSATNYGTAKKMTEKTRVRAWSGGGLEHESATTKRNIGGGRKRGGNV